MHTVPLKKDLITVEDKAKVVASDWGTESFALSSNSILLLFIKPNLLTQSLKLFRGKITK